MIIIHIIEPLNKAIYIIPKSKSTIKGGRRIRIPMQKIFQSIINFSDQSDLCLNKSSIFVSSIFCSNRRKKILLLLLL